MCECGVPRWLRPQVGVGQGSGSTEGPGPRWRGTQRQVTPTWPETDLEQVTSDMLRRGLVAGHLRPGLS